MSIRIYGNLSGEISNVKSNLSGEISNPKSNLSGSLSHSVLEVPATDYSELTGTPDLSIYALNEDLESFKSTYNSSLNVWNTHVTDLKRTDIELQTALENKSDTGHDHYAKIGVVEYNIQGAFDLLRKAAVTELQVNQLILKNAALKDHEHEGYLTEHQDISGKADITYVDNAILERAALKDHEHEEYALKTELPSIEGLASTSYVDNAIKDHEHEEYLTEHQDISGKADITYVDNAINNALGIIEDQLDEIIGEEV